MIDHELSRADDAIHADAPETEASTVTPKSAYGPFGCAAGVMSYLRSVVRNGDSMSNEEIELVDRTINDLLIWEKSSDELLEVLREKWPAVPSDALTLYLGAFMSGFVSEWQKNPPENGVTTSAVFPGIGKVEIEIRRVEGKSAAERLAELEGNSRRASATATPSAHTPGPWNIDGQFDSEISVEILSGRADDPKAIQICELVPFLEDWTPEEIANARLIAAAPELLEVAHELCRVFSLEPVGTLVNALEALYNRTRILIAKAEGRA